MSDPKACALDISLVSDFSLDASAPVRLSIPSVLQIEPEAIALLQALARHAGDQVGTAVGVRFVDLNRKLWSREGETALANELAIIVREGLDLAEAASVEATA